MRVPLNGERVKCAGICACEKPEPKKVKTYLQKPEKDPLELDLTSVGLSEETFPFERYAPLAILGISDRATTLMARDRARGAKVAVKCLKRVSLELKPTFESEARKLKELNHTNIAKLLDFGFQNNKAPYLVSEYKDGFNIDQCIALYGIPGFDVAVKILLGACDAIVSAQTKGVLHGDVRPGNLIFLDDNNSEPSVAVVDFALPKIKASEPMTEPADAMWMSGDEARNLDYSEKSEVYSIGAVGFDLLTGRAPFTEGGAQEIKNQHALQLPPRIPKLNFDPTRPKDLEEVIERCLEKDPSYRFETVAKLQERLEVFPRRHQLKIAAIEAAKKRKKVLVAAGAGLAALAVIALGFIVLAHPH